MGWEGGGEDLMLGFEGVKSVGIWPLGLETPLMIGAELEVFSELPSAEFS